MLKYREHVVYSGECVGGPCDGKYRAHTNFILEVWELASPEKYYYLSDGDLESGIQYRVGIYEYRGGTINIRGDCNGGHWAWKGHRT